METNQTTGISAKHTPGPWVVENKHVIAPQGHCVAICPYTNIQPQAEANGRLIAAAPDGYASNTDAEAAITEALAEAHRLNDAARETVFNPAVFQLLGSALVKCRAAIAKAEGRA